MVCVAKGQYYTIDDKKKVVVFDTTVKPTNEEREDLIMFSKMGYDVRKKINRQVKKGNVASLKDADIKKLLANKEALKKYESLKDLPVKEGGGFLNARSAVSTELKEAMNAKTSKK